MQVMLANSSVGIFPKKLDTRHLRCRLYTFLYPPQKFPEHTRDI